MTIMRIDNEIASLYAKGLSTSQIGGVLNISQSSVHARMVAANIPRRSSAEGVHLAKRNDGPLLFSADVQSVIDGALLSDGSLLGGNYSGRFSLSQITPHADWIYAVANKLRANGLETQLSMKPSSHGVIKGQNIIRQPVLQLRSKHYSIFLNEYRRWYPNRTKIVPSDLSLTPLSLAYWYCGDGCIHNKGYNVVFCTDGFSFGDVELLISKMSQTFCFSPKHDPKRNRIFLTKQRDRIEFLRLVSNHIPSCFRYKLALQTGAIRMKLTAETRAALFQHHVDGHTYEDLMLMYGMSKSGIASAIKRHSLLTGVCLPRRRGRSIELWA